MAVGFPVKDDYATGDVLTAANMNDFAGTLNIVPNTIGASNPVLNSAFQIAQRGTTFSFTVGAYTLDRWQGFRANSAAYDVSRQATSDTTNLSFIQNCARVGRPSGNAALDPVLFLQTFETANSIPYAGKTVTLSFYARRGANFSSSSNILNARIITGTGTDQNRFSFTGATNAFNTNATLTTTWQRFSVTGLIPATVTEFAPEFTYTPVGTAGANDYFEVTGVQIDVGSVAQQFRTYAATIQGELAACQRYYYRSGGESAYNAFGNGYAASATVGSMLVRLPVTMRVKPTSVDFSTLALFDGTTVNAVSALSLVSTNSSKDVVYLDATSTSLTQFRNYALLTNNSTSGYLGLNAEL
jgi:hypothetical protein